MTQRGCIISCLMSDEGSFVFTSLVEPPPQEKVNLPYIHINITSEWKWNIYCKCVCVCVRCFLVSMHHPKWSENWYFFIEQKWSVFGLTPFYLNIIYMR